MYALKQSEIVGTPFAITQEDARESWQRWTDEEGNRKKYIGRFNDEKQFEQWDNNLRQWVNIVFKKADGWKKTYSRRLTYETIIHASVWDKEARANIEADIEESFVEFTAGVEMKLQVAMQSEVKRGSDPTMVYFMLTKKSTGPLPMNVEYTVAFEKVKEGATEEVASSAPKVEVAAPVIAATNPEAEKITNLIGALKMQTASLEKDKIMNFKAQLLTQIEGELAKRGIKSTTAEAIFTNHIMVKGT